MKGADTNLLRLSISGSFVESTSGKHSTLELPDNFSISSLPELSSYIYHSDSAWPFRSRCIT